jgi:multiple sugar transport system permease protein
VAGATGTVGVIGNRDAGHVFRVRRGFARGGMYAVLWLGILVMALPFFWMVTTSLKTPLEILRFPPTWLPTGQLVERAPGEWQEVTIVSKDAAAGTVAVRPLEGGPERTIPAAAVANRLRLRFRNYVDAWNQAPFGRYYLNTIFVTLCVTAGEIFISSLAAYAFARMRFWAREGIFLVFLSMMMVPEPVYIVPSYIILAKLGWIDRYPALIVPWLASVFSIFLMRQHFRTIPNDLYDAAIIDGCSRFAFLYKIVFPLSKAILAAVVIFTAIATWNSFMWPLVMTNTAEMRPLQVGLARFSQSYGTSHELMMAAAAFSIAPLIVAYFFAQKQIIQSLATSGMKG